jgi:reverse gyrase
MYERFKFFMVSYKPVDLNKKRSDALIVHCCDPRFVAAYHQAAGQVSEFYDLMAVPGASKAIVENPTIIDNIKMLHSLHHFKSIHIMDHVECGAFGEIDDEVESHSKYLHLAEKKINKTLAGVNVVPHLLGARQELALNA